MAAAQAAITALSQDDLIARGAALGKRLLARLNECLTNGPATGVVREVRGRGLLIGIQFSTADMAGEFMFKLLDRDVISCHSMNAGEVVRLTPPAIMDSMQEDWLIEAAADAAKSLPL
jgi:putrescine aminotransferase